ncbi:hypothetical protein [Methylobacterium gnaphalii]|uniref:Uncharacterized protein n=1 Tax=Methylobacterium gnaphalii TaxID=1010610 RepID=A0A512JMA4_9HYPH|nr:hypothetical protein [Methylobacterium gnaphalii]GEP11106.1 hypothetical protein MGN01_29510 [Methylobacterium gnaphalii]GJD69896.1 hypothetical protein MMMDOFMJ_2835 [Methylobacterium gnaphalii]GLS50384.1 hypothetical protein GCM10007885_32360 [Methylobacterium gnaphalii]
MDGWQNIAGQLAQIGLPALGGLFGGPLGSTIGGIVGKGVAAALGVDPTPQAVAAAVQADPNGSAVKLAEIEAETKRQQGSLEDIANARAMESVAIQSGHSIAWVPVGFSVLNYVILAVVIAGVAMGWLREDGIIVGFALGAATSAMNFWLGSSESSKRNADTVRQVASSPKVIVASSVHR